MAQRPKKVSNESHDLQLFLRVTRSAGSGSLNVRQFQMTKGNCVIEMGLDMSRDNRKSLWVVRSASFEGRRSSYLPLLLSINEYKPYDQECFFKAQQALGCLFFT